MTISNKRKRRYKNKGIISFIDGTDYTSYKEFKKKQELKWMFGNDYKEQTKETL